MKKILIWVCSFILMMFMTACDNNEGPFSTRVENQKTILYSGTKPASGWVEDFGIYDEDILGLYLFKGGEAKIEYKKGIPSGNFYISYGDLGLKAEGKLKDKGNFYEGKIKVKDLESNNIEINGKFKYDFEKIYTYFFRIGNNLWIRNFESNIVDLIIGGKIDLKGVNGTLKGELNEGSGTIEAHYYNGILARKTKYLDGYPIEKTEYYENGNKRYELNKDGEIKYYSNGKIEKENIIKNGKERVL